jgi:copper chaperone NosL
MTRRSCLPIFALAAAILSCTGADAPPAPLDTKNEACRSCRMPVSDARLAAQLAAPGEEPKFFDDIGCLREFLKQGEPERTGTVAYVADHRTGAWVRAARAAYSRCPALETPMGYHVVAHVDDASRSQDPALRACAPVAAAEIFGPDGPPDGKKRS